MSRNDRLAPSAIIIFAFTGIGVAAGLAVDLLIAIRFTIGPVTDAYYTSITLPLLITAAALSAGQTVFVVAFTPGPDPAADSRLFSALFTNATLLGFLLGVAGSLLSPVIIIVLAPGFGPPEQALAVGLSRILFWRVPAVLMMEIIRAMLYARRDFAVAASGNALPGLVAVGLLLLFPEMSIFQVGVVIVLGNWVSAIWMAGALAVKRHVAFRPRFGWRDPALSRVAREVVIPVGATLLRQTVVVAERWFGSLLAPGSITALGYANKMTQVLAGTLYSSITIAGLPRLSSLISQGRVDMARETLRRLFRFTLAIAFPLSAGIALLSPFLLPRLAELSKGVLSVQEGELIAAVFIPYSLSLLFLGPFRVQQTFFYALRRPLWVGGVLAVATVVTLLLDWPLSAAWGAPGLGWSFSFGIMVAMILGIILTGRYFKSPDRPQAAD